LAVKKIEARLKSKTTKKRAAPSPRSALTSEATVELAVRTVMAHKGMEPVILGVKGLCGFADYFVICSGTSRRHVMALAQHLEEEMARAGVKPLGMEGLQDGHWILLDFNDLVVHIFLQPMREFYDLEGLWAEAERLTFDNLPAEPVQPETVT
jgi:ribosome-associated protein